MLTGNCCHCGCETELQTLTDTADCGCQDREEEVAEMQDAIDEADDHRYGFDAWFTQQVATSEKVDPQQPAMTIKQSHPRGYGKPRGKGFVMYGSRPDSESRKWFERWYPTKEKAQAFADKRGWATKHED